MTTSKLTIDTSKLTPEQLKALAIIQGNGNVKTLKVGETVSGFTVDKVYPDGHARLVCKEGKVIEGGLKVYSAYTSK